jgi:small GTP-binding protein
MIFRWKIAVVGDPSVGKTSLIRRFVTGAFSESYLSTIGVTFLRKELTLEQDVQANMQVWDLGGQSIFANMRTNYLRGTNGALIVFDLTQKTTLAHVQQWVDEVNGVVGHVPLIIIGNKSDLPYKDSIVEHAQAIAQNLQFPFMKTSAKTGDQMEEAFFTIARNMYKEYMNRSTEFQNDFQPDIPPDSFTDSPPNVN